MGQQAGLGRVWRWLRHPALGVLGAVIALATIGNFLWTLSEFTSLGGDAAGGRIEDGRYFVGNRGEYQEVSREEWEWSRFHGQFFLPVHFLGMAANAYLLFVWIFPRFAGPIRPETPQRVAEVRAFGRPLASADVTAQLGWMRMRAPMMHVDVHPGGIVLHPRPMPPRAIRRSELLGVEGRPAALGGFRDPRLTVHHAAPDVGKTVRIAVEEGHPLAQAIRSLLPG